MKRPRIRGKYFLPLLTLLAFTSSGLAHPAAPSVRTLGASTVAAFSTDNSSKADRGKFKDSRRCTEQHPCKTSVPDGGTTGAYLLLSGIFCCAAILSRARRTPDA